MEITAIKEDSVTGRGGVPWLSWLALASLAVSPAAMSQDKPPAPPSTLDEQLQRERTQRQVDAQQAARNAPDVRLARQAVADFHTTELPVETPCFDEIRHGCERTVLRHRERTARTCEAQRSVQTRQRADPRVKVFRKRCRKRCQVDLFFSKHCRGRQDLNPQAAYLYANNALTLAAGNNINLTDAHDLHSEQHDTQTSSFSFFSTSSKRLGSALTRHTKFVWALDGLNKYSIRRFQ